MPYGNDEFLKEVERIHLACQDRAATEEDLQLRVDLKKKYDVPDEFMDLAVKIWWDGKED